jgi:hypothetical protein
MTTATMTKRVDRIEARQRPGAAQPTWLSVANEADVEAALAAMPDGWRGNVYIGISPDDWDTDHDAQTATAC